MILEIPVLLITVKKLYMPLTLKPGTKTHYMPPEAGEGEYDHTLDIYGHLAIYVFLQKHRQKLKKATYSSDGNLLARKEVVRREVAIY